MWPHTACGIETEIGSLRHYCTRYVTCDLIPLAVLKPVRRKDEAISILRHMWPHTACGIETWGRFQYGKILLLSHVTSYRLRYWNPSAKNDLSGFIHVTCDLIPLAVLKLRIGVRVRTEASGHMWPHTACGIETYLEFLDAVQRQGHMWPHTACGIETVGVTLLKVPKE